MYKIEFTQHAKKNIRDLGSDAGRALKAIHKLREDPLKGKPLKDSLRGLRSVKFVGPGGEYRAAYCIDEDESVCIVLIVAPRESTGARFRTSSRITPNRSGSIVNVVSHRARRPHRASGMNSTPGKSPP